MAVLVSAPTMCAYERKDHLYKKAKSEGMRSRAAYKLVEIDQRFHILVPGTKVLDLGAWPGGWLQIALQRIGQSGLAVGIDLVEIRELDDPRLLVVEGDARDEEIIGRAMEFAGGQFDLILSDMSPKLTGVRDIDMPASLGLVELCLHVAGRALRPGGNLVCKTFKGGGVDAFVKSARPLFNKIVRSELDSTRKTSNEFYIIGLGYKGQAPES